MAKSKKPRWAVEHKPTNRFVYEDEGGLFLFSEEDGIFSFGDKKKAEEALKYLKQGYDVNNNGIIVTEDGDFPIEEFEVSEI